MTDLPLPEGALRASALITNRRGLHARAAAKFVKLAGQFESAVQVSHRGMDVSGLSIMGLMMLAAAPGTTVELAAHGTDAQAALDAIVGLITEKFGED